MSVRAVVQQFLNLGPLPDTDAPVERIEHHQLALEKIGRAVSDEEAALLVNCFGPDDGYGLAWSLLHLIESVPGGIPLGKQPAADENEWLRRLWARSHRDL